MNSVNVVGYYTAKPSDQNPSKQQAHAKITLEVLKNFRDADGLYSVEEFPIYIWKGATRTFTEHLQEGQLISIKGRLEYIDDVLCIVAEQFEVLKPTEFMNKY